MHCYPRTDNVLTCPSRLDDPGFTLTDDTPLSQTGMGGMRRYGGMFSTETFATGAVTLHDATRVGDRDSTVQISNSELVGKEAKMTSLSIAEDKQARGMKNKHIQLPVVFLSRSGSPSVKPCWMDPGLSKGRKVEAAWHVLDPR
jgi:hypothetical protein